MIAATVDVGCFIILTTMWLFSSSTATDSTNNAGNAHCEDSELNANLAEEETCCTGGVSTSSNQIPSDNDGIARRRRKLGRGIIYFRPIKPEDRTVIEALHRQWFPVDYKSEFFDSLCNDGNMPGTNQPLYSCVAILKELDDFEFGEMYEKRERESCSMPLFWQKEKHSSTFRYYCNDTNDECILWGGYSDADSEEEDYKADSLQCQSPKSTKNVSTSDDCCVSTDKNDKFPATSIHQQDEREKMKRFYSNGFRFDNGNGGFNQNSTVQNDVTDKERQEDNDQSNKDDSCNFVNDCGEIIVGCVVGSFLSSSMFSAKTGARDETAALLVPDPDEYPEMFYIMTLGTSLRRVGLGSILVNRVVDMIKAKQECGALYLHVITYNETAIKLYERLGFSRVKKIAGERTPAFSLEHGFMSFILTLCICCHRSGYYTINSVNYDCYLYARYFHGNLGHNNADYLSNFSRLILRKISGGLIAG